MKQKIIQKEVELKEGVEAKLENKILTIKGKKGELKRKFIHPQIKISIKNNKIMLSVENSTKREKTMAGTFIAHIKNMIKGVSEGFTYKLKICSGHFPMNVAVENKNVVIKNFLGEKIPRKAKIISGAKILIQGDTIMVEGIDKEIVAQSASNIEMSCKITNRDRRVFQDGCYIISKDGKKIK